MSDPVGFTDEPRECKEGEGFPWLVLWVALILLALRFNQEVGQWLAALLIGELT